MSEEADDYVGKTPIYSEEGLSSHILELDENSKIFEFGVWVSKLSNAKKETAENLKELEEKWLDLVAVTPQEELSALVDDMDSNHEINKSVKKALKDLYSRYLGWDLYPPDIESWDDKQMAAYLKFHTSEFGRPPQWGAPKDPWSEKPYLSRPYHEVAEASICTKDDILNLLKIANRLDGLSLFKEADIIDDVIISLAAPSGRPDYNEINKIMKGYFDSGVTSTDAGPKFCEEHGRRFGSGGSQHLPVIFQGMSWASRDNYPSPARMSSAQAWINQVSEFAERDKRTCKRGGDGAEVGAEVGTEGEELAHEPNPNVWSISRTDDHNFVFQDITADKVVQYINHAGPSVPRRNWIVWKDPWQNWVSIGCPAETAAPEECEVIKTEIIALMDGIADAP